jgi:hypothetical protein
MTIKLGKVEVGSVGLMLREEPKESAKEIIRFNNEAIIHILNDVQGGDYSVTVNGNRINRNDWLKVKSIKGETHTISNDTSKTGFVKAYYVQERLTGIITGITEVKPEIVNFKLILSIKNNPDKKFELSDFQALKNSQNSFVATIDESFAEYCFNDLGESIEFTINL